MPLLFKKVIRGNEYKVVRAGRSTRLYTNGLFHSQFNDRTIISGAVWDLLLLPAFMLPQKPQSVLVLGVGGGAVIRMLDYFFAGLAVTGVDINPTHIQLAKKYFNVAGKNIRLISDDAQHWLKSRKSSKFDIVIDDVFGGYDGDPQRPFAFDEDWIKCLLCSISKRGVLVINLDQKKLVKPFLNTFRSAFEPAEIKIGWLLSSPGFENRILVLSKTMIKRAEFFDRIQQQPILDARKKTCRLVFSMTRCYLAE